MVIMLRKIGANIYGGAEAKLEYIEFWKEKFTRLQKRMNNMGDYEAISKSTDDLKIIGQIYRNDMGEFLNFCRMRMVKVFRSCMRMTLKK